jgi:hypothetical protein
MYLFEDSEIYRAVLESMQNGIYLVDRGEKKSAAIWWAPERISS